MADVYDQLLDEQKTTTAPAAPAVPAQSKDAYDTILDGFQAEQDKALQQSLTQAMKVAPQQAATTQQLAKASGLPEDVVERNKDVVQQQVKLREIQSLLAASPILARQMQDPAFAKLAQSDANTLSTIERLWRGTSGGAVEGLGMGTAGIGDVLGIVQRNTSEWFARAFLPTPIGGWDKVDKASIAGPLLGQDWQTVGNYLKQQGRDIQIPQLQQTFFDQVLAGVGQVGSQVAVNALTGGAGSAAFLYGQGANAMTEKVQGDNASQGAKDLAVLSGAGVTALTEKWALDKLLGPMAVPIQNQVGAALARIGIAGASEGAQETIESISQDAIRQFLTNPDAPIQVGQAFEEGGVGATVGAIVRSVVEAAAGVRGRAMRADQDAAKAERDAQMIEQLNKLAAASELLQTSPETFQQFIEAAAEDSDVQNVYIDAQTLMQSGMADQLAQVSPAVAQQLPTALATGGTVQIPVGEYAAKIAPTEFAQGLLDHIKTDPQGFSRAEAQEYYQNFQQQLEQEIAQQLQAKAGDEEFQASKERVKQTVLTELNNLGRFTPQKNEVDAALIAARTAVRAAQLGMTPEAFFEQQRLRFAAQNIAGDTFSQDGQLQTDTPAFKNWFGDSKVVDEQGNPLVVYHGSENPNITEFDTTGESSKAASKRIGTKGAYFTKKPMHSDAYAGPQGSVYPVYLSIKNPLVVTGESIATTGIRGLLNRLVYGRDKVELESRLDRFRMGATQYLTNEDIDALKAAGYDGIVNDNASEIIAFEPTQIKSATGNAGTFDPNNPNILNQAAYHGTPHRFDRFSLDAIGTGEGAQVYGWGLYFAGNKEVAEWYRDSLTNARAQMVDNSRLEVGGQVVDKSSEDYEFLLTIERAGGFGPYITDRQMSLLDLQPDHPVYRARVKTIERAKALQEKYGDAQLEYVLDIQMEKADGTLYQVDIPEDNDLLDYSAKFLDQPEKVKQAIAKLFNDIGQFDLLVTNPSGVDIYNFLSEAAAEGRQFEASRTFTDKEEALAFYKEKMAKWRGNEGQMIQPKAEQDFDDNWQVTFGQELDEVFGIQGTMSADRSASLALNKVGIPGLRYQDGMSRGGEGNSYNYVIWDENAVTVEAVNNELAQAEAQAQGEYFQSGLAQTDTPAFKNWFGDSKVVDEQGKPLRMYHGTKASFDTFKSSKQSGGLLFFTDQPAIASEYAMGDRVGYTELSAAEELAGYSIIAQDYPDQFNGLELNDGIDQDTLESIMFDLDSGVSNELSRKLGDGEITPAEAIKQYNKHVGALQMGGAIMPVYIQAKNPAGSKENPIPWREAEKKGAAAYKAEGYDSVYVSEGSGVALAVFDPAQVKSATGNAGTFDPNDPNILFQGGRPALPDSLELWGYLHGHQGLSVAKLVGILRQYKAAARDMHIAADGDFGPFSQDIIDQIPNAQLVFATGEDKGFAVDDNGYGYTIFKGRVIDHKQKNADEARGMSRNFLKAKIADMRNNDPVEMQRRQEQERRDAIEAERAKRIENAPKLSGDFQADLKALAEYAQNYQEFQRLLTADMLDVSNRNRTRLARAMVALEPDAVTAANVLEKEPALVEDYLKFGTPAEKSVAAMLNSKAKTIIIYRGMPADQQIEAGDWVSFSKAYAKGHESNVEGGKAATKQKTVSKKDVYWYGADVNEWVYVPEGTFGNVKSLRELWESLGQGSKPDGYADDLYQFAGVRSRTADLGQLEVARGMAERGLSAAQIQRETGWTKGVDGQWRYEISDDQAKFKENTVDAAAVAAEAEPFIQTQVIGNQYKAVYDNGNSMEWLAVFGWSEEEARANLVRKLVERKGGDGFDINKVKVDYPYTLGEVLDHPALFAAYPDLANINIKFTKSDDGSSGVYMERSNRIELEASLDRQQMLSTLLHEIQHAIQAREDFARGGAPERTFTDSVKKVIAQMKANVEFKIESWKRYNWDKLDDVEASREMASNALKYQSAQRLIEYSKRDKPSGVFRLIRNEMQWIYGEQFYGNRQANDLQRMFYDLPKRGDKRNAFLRNMAFEGAQFLLESIPAEQRQTFKDDPRTLQSLIKALQRQASKARKELAPLQELEAEARTAEALNAKTQYKTPFDIYRALAGELEARTTQARQKLTPEERRNRPIRLDMDVDPSEAIVIMGGREFRLPSVMRSQAAPTPRGAFNPNTNTIALLKNADLSTFLHEAGHYFFESDIALAAEIAHGNNALGADTMTQGEREILADVSTLFKWLGINGDINEQLAQWYSLSFEEKRAYHEKTAESFERYLFEGKAPSIELQSYFQQFRAWLVNVYKSIKDFLARNPAAGELSDEVRAVFDRMLASTEEIQLAEQARSMMPLFRTQADADNIGMTAEEFRAYQSQDIQATNDAIQDLQARAVRDLQWTRNAHNREVKRLQRKAADLRAEARIEARAEVLSEPIYRAWQFLTRKLQEGDKITPYQRPKSDPNVVDPTIDSLFTAMAKLGGLNKQEAVETWGVEESERPNSGVFGKPVLRANGGKSIDGMVEALAQYGYLPLDANGKADIADFEQKFDEELRGNTQYSIAYDYGMEQADQMRPGEGVNLLALGAGRLDLGALADMGFSKEEIELLKARRMTATNGLHPDLVAELPGVEMGSGDELVRKLLEATPLKEEIDARTDALMLERHGELATPEAIAREADKAIHNEARAKMVATEANALAKATGERKILAKAAKQLAEMMVARIKIRDIKPTQYASAEARAAKNAEKAAKSGDLRTAAAEKRSQLVNTYATDAAYKAQDEINAALRYLRKFENEGSRKGLDPEYLDQIDSLLERFDLRKGQSLKTIDKRESLAKWIAAQEEQGIEPDLPAYITAEANRVHYKNLTVEEFRGLVDSVKQIEHLGRLKKKLLTAKDQRELDAIVDEISTRIEQSSDGRVVDNEVRNIMQDKLRTGFNQFLLAHRKAASLARELDGFEDGGPVWEYFIRPMNEAGDYEVAKRAEVSAKLHELSKPIVAGEEMGGKGRWFPSLGRNLNRGERLAIALNWGNDSNRQRLLGGRGWTAAQVQPVLDTLTAQEWQFVQGVWNLFESFRPEIGAKEKRVSGKEPDWIEATPLNITTADGQQLQLRGGYYPVKYDPRQSGKAGEHSEAEQAKQMLRAAYTAATTRRSFTKSRAAEVHDRPLLLSFDGIQQGLNEVIHDLAWHEWLIDANKLLRRLDKPIRTNYGADFVDMLKKSVKDIATGDTPAANAIEKYLSHARNGATIVGMGWNLTTALLQLLGFTQTAVRIGPKWMGRGISSFFGSPSHMIAKAEEVNSKSKLMANRALTLNREINDVLNRLETSKSETYQRIESTFFIMIQKMQAMVDYPTWLGAYDKALADPANSEERAIALADQAVLDAQGGGQTKDLALVQRGSPLLKLFTNFYSYFNVLYNLTTEQTKKRVKAKEYGGLLTDYTMLMIVPAVMSAVLRNVLKGEDDEDKYAKDILGELVGMPFGMFLVLREMADAVKLAAGVGNPGLGYSGPAGLRFFNEVYKLGQQAGQGEWDMALFKAANNVAGILFHYPAGQVNRLVEGTVELIEGKTSNPVAPLVGVQK